MAKTQPTNAIMDKNLKQPNRKRVKNKNKHIKVKSRKINLNDRLSWQK